MREKIDFLLATLDYHLISGKSVEEAWIQTLKSYAFVYHHRDRDDINASEGKGDAAMEEETNWRLNATIDRLISNIPAACKVLLEEGYVSLASQLARDQRNLVYWQECGVIAWQQHPEEPISNLQPPITLYAGGMFTKARPGRANIQSSTSNLQSPISNKEENHDR